jgi:hypothetical protein
MAGRRARKSASGLRRVLIRGIAFMVLYRMGR